MASSKSKRQGLSQLRIIGGNWRSRKLAFTAEEGLRPTTDRIRETLFNWLAPEIAGAKCADLFAGSGALGLEALSRGAAHCDFVDRSAAVIQQIAGNLATLEASELGYCHHGSWSQYLDASDTPLDIVFIDPPFGKGLTLPTCRALTASKRLSAEAMVYVELSSQEARAHLPEDWAVYRQKTTGGVTYGLYLPPRP
ncbi:MAG: 16S rRNA (guanine(966)-N(2))-methyltransferase RsmD [Halioglobus sp.]